MALLLLSVKDLHFRELEDDISNLSAILPFLPAAVNSAFGVHWKLKARLDELKEELKLRVRAEATWQWAATLARQRELVQTNPVQILKRGTTLAEAARQEKAAATAQSKQSKSKGDKTRRAQDMKKGALLPRSCPFTEAAGPPSGNVKGFAPAWTRRQRVKTCAPKPSTPLPLIPEESASLLDPAA